MAEPTYHDPAVPMQIAAEQYEQHYAAQFYEWVDGEMLKMSPASLKHIHITSYLNFLLSVYFRLNPIGQVVVAPFLLELPALAVKREPDLQIILNTNPGQLTPTKMIGPPDICIEVVSPESMARDYSEKLLEYERGGVREYWIFDPVREASLFYRLDSNSHYKAQPLDPQGQYRTALLPKFVLHVPTLWQDDLPFDQIPALVNAMLAAR